MIRDAAFGAGQRGTTKRLVALGHAAYFLATGIWPLLDVRGFERITGPKVDRWLVKTVGALVSVIGTAIALGAWRRRLTPEIELLAVGSSLALAAVDVVYVARRRIRPVYLLDAVAHLGFTAGWAIARRSDPAAPRRARRSGWGGDGRSRTVD